MSLARFVVRGDVLPNGDAVGVVEAFGELDLSTVGDFVRAIRHCVGGQGVVVDLTGVTFMDCSALRALIPLRREMEKRGGRVCLVATRASVLRLFELTRTNFALVADGEQARSLLERR